MENIAILALKIQKMTEILKKTKDENLRLKTELAYLRRESEENKKKINKYIVLKDKSEQAALKIERILKKIDTLKAS
jgi:ribosomal protein L18E